MKYHISEPQAEVCGDSINRGIAHLLEMSAFVSGSPDSFNLLKGELSFYIKLADSGAKRELAFCGKCGTRIYAKPENGKSGFFGLRVGTIRQRKSLHPKRQAWKKSCLDWVQGIKTDQTFETQPKLN